MVAAICLLHGVVVVCVSASLILFAPKYLGVWANVLGVTSAILATIQYLPQIRLTYTLGHVGSLSIPMMLIQTPGSFVWSASLIVRLGIAGWSTWGVFLVTGCLQGCLLGMGIYFEVKARMEKQKAAGVVSFLTSFIRIFLTYDSLLELASLAILQVQDKKQMMKEDQMLRILKGRR